MGRAKVYILPNGKTVIDEDSLRRDEPSLAGDETGYDDDYDFEGDDGDFEGDDETGRRGRRGGGRGRRNKKRAIESGKTDLGANGAGTITIRPQYDFELEDLTFDGSEASTVITSVKVGKELVLNEPDGVPISLFATGSNMRDFLKGQVCPSGLDIEVGFNISNTNGGRARATVTGWEKPGRRGRR